MTRFPQLEIAGEATSARIAPARGALVTSLVIDGRELLYLDAATFENPDSNVRGGIPVLFPSPGKLTDDRWQTHGRAGSMKQHGFARTLPWQVDQIAADSLRLRLTANDITRAQFPWAFEATLQFAVIQRALKITTSIRNLDAARMPFALGFHPYFRAGDRHRIEVPTQATRAFNNVSKRVEPFTGFDFTQDELDLHLLDHGAPSASLRTGTASGITIEASADFALWVIWSLRDKPYVCVEPWTAAGNALNTGERLIELAPGALHSSWVTIRA